MSPIDDATTCADGRPRKLRSACDICHETKIKCTGGPRCAECTRLGISCRFSHSRTGRPKGAKNKSTLERIRIYEAQNGAYREPGSLPASKTPSSRQSTADHSRRNSIMSSSQPDVTGCVDASSVDMFAMPDLLDTPWPGPSNLFAGLAHSEMQSSCQIGLPAAHSIETRDSEDISAALDLGYAYSNPASSIPSLMTSPTVPLSFPPPSHHLHGFTDTPLASEIADVPQFRDISPASQAVLPQAQTCTCLSTTMEHLCRIKHLEKRQLPSIPADALLLAAEQMLQLLVQILQCPVCQGRPDPEVTLFAAVNVRIIVRAFMSLVLSRDDASPQRSRSRRSSLDSACRADLERHNSSSLDAASAAVLRIGQYPVNGSDGELLMNFVLLRTLSKFRPALARLKGQLALPADKSPSAAGHEEKFNLARYSSVNMISTSCLAVADSIGQPAETMDAYGLSDLITSTEATIDSLTRRLQQDG